MRRSPTAPLFGVLVGSGLIMGCGEALGPQGEKLVRVADDAFDPVTKTIQEGDKVLWEWKGSHEHNVTWLDSSGAGNSATQTTGTYTRDFSSTGSYDYYCTIHGTPTSGMRGTIVVE